MIPYKRIAVKVGSNVLTRKDGTLDITRMSSLVDQLSELHKRGLEIVLISSGAVASGRGEIRVEKKKLDSVSARQLYSAVGQVKLINRYYELFREHGITCGQVLTTKENFGSRTHYLNQKRCMEALLENKVIPIVNENDTVSVTELMFTDNDELSGLIASMMQMDALIILSNVDGIYNGDPSDPESFVIPEIKRKEEVSDYVQASKSAFGRGGMLTKCTIAQKVANEGIAVVIANGRRDHILPDLLDTGIQVVCTYFRPSEKPASSLKKWIAHSEDFAKGEVHINQGAAEALQGKKAVSILPVGITEIRGNFEKDDIVRIIDHKGRQIGVGCAGYDSRKAAALIGRHDNKPLIHYDYLCLD